MSAAFVIGSTCVVAEDDKLGPEFVLFLERCSTLDTALDMAPGRLPKKFSAAATLMFGVMSTLSSSDSSGREMPAQAVHRLDLVCTCHLLCNAVRCAACCAHTHTLCRQPYAVGRTKHAYVSICCMQRLCTSHFGRDVEQSVSKADTAAQLRTKPASRGRIGWQKQTGLRFKAHLTLPEE